MSALLPQLAGLALAFLAISTILAPLGPVNRNVRLSYTTATFKERAPSGSFRKSSRHRKRARTAHRRSTSEVSVRRRVIRMMSLADLERREAQLHEFLVKAHTETAQLVDDEVHVMQAGVAIGPAVVTADFLGSPIIRARVRAVASGKLSVLIEAHLHADDGTTASAARAVELHAGETQTVELLCPTRLLPSSLIWSALQL